MDEFYRKNDIGVKILYTVVGYYMDGGKKYCIYTDFVPDNNRVGIRLFVDLVLGDKMERLSEKEEKVIIKKFNKEIMENRKK